MEFYKAGVMLLSEKELLEQDAKRNIGEELLTAINSVKAGDYGHRNTVSKTKTTE